MSLDLGVKKLETKYFDYKRRMVNMTIKIKLFHQYLKKDTNGYKTRFSQIQN